MILGWCTEIPSWRGLGGTRIPAFGMKALIFRGESALRSVRSQDGDGDGVIGDSIGITATQLLTTTGTTPTAAPSTTATISIGVVESAAAGSTVPETPGLHEDMRNPEGRAA